jgi:hypothetical protein
MAKTNTRMIKVVREIYFLEFCGGDTIFPSTIYPFLSFSPFIYFILAFNDSFSQQMFAAPFDERTKNEGGLGEGFFARESPGFPARRRRRRAKSQRRDFP